jgi:hypothetical protein
VIVTSEGTPQRAGEIFGCPWVLLRVLGTSLGVQAARQEAPRITAEQSRKNNNLFENTACGPSNDCYYRSFNNFKTRIVNLYSHLRIHVSI